MATLEDLETTLLSNPAARARFLADTLELFEKNGVDVNTAGSDSSEDASESGSPESGQTQAEQGAEGSKTASRGTSGAGGKGSGRQQDSASYADDDIVARQLREAAENETDPELKEKLWKEYYEYKNSQK